MPKTMLEKIRFFLRLYNAKAIKIQSASKDDFVISVIRR